MRGLIELIGEILITLAVLIPVGIGSAMATWWLISALEDAMGVKLP